MSINEQMGELRSAVARGDLSDVCLDPEHREVWLEYLKRHVDLVVKHAKWDQVVQDYFAITLDGSLVLGGMELLRLYPATGLAHARAWIRDLVSEELLNLPKEYYTSSGGYLIEKIGTALGGGMYQAQWLQDNIRSMRGLAYQPDIRREERPSGSYMIDYGERAQRTPSAWLYALAYAALWSLGGVASTTYHVVHQSAALCPVGFIGSRRGLRRLVATSPAQAWREHVVKTLVYT